MNSRSAPPPPYPPTLGMRLDSYLAQLDSLSSTQLYGVIVLVTVAVSFLLLGSNTNVVEPTLPAASSAASTSATAAAAKTKTLAGPQPRWHILKWLNYAALLSFGGSVVHVGFFLGTTTTEPSLDGWLVYYLVGWSLFLCYFFGFFGISFVQTEELALAQQQQQQQQATTSVNTKTSSSLTRKQQTLHPPAAATPVCSDNNNNNNKQPQGQLQAQTPRLLQELSNEQIAQLVLTQQLKDHELEKKLDPFRAVHVRRCAMNRKLATLHHCEEHATTTTNNNYTGILDKLPSTPSLDYARVLGANCEIVVGYVPLPVGMVGPLTLNNESLYIPMATTEGCLVASTNRGVKAITQGGGATAVLLRDGITRAPCVRMGSAKEAAYLKLWCEEPTNFATLKSAFESTTSFGKLKACHPTVAGRNVYLRLVCFSGDAMGMNMVSKGSLAVIHVLQQQFSSLTLVALSGNMCTDKKAAATNWIEGRGKSVVAEAVVPKDVVRSTLKTTVKAMVETNLHKNLVGSAMAGTIGGFNAHASNIVTAIFLATGQDPAQNVESSNCITLLEETPQGDLWISVTMPSIEVGTVGGGTSLEAQSACLEAIGVKGGGAIPGENAQKLAKVVAASTMAGELSLLAALAANTLVQAHMQHNRKQK